MNRNNPVLLHDDGSVIICPNCGDADELVALDFDSIVDGQGLGQFGPGGGLNEIRGDSPELVGAFECGSCGDFFTPEHAGKRDVEDFTLASRGVTIDNFDFATWSEVRTSEYYDYPN